MSSKALSYAFQWASKGKVILTATGTLVTGLSSWSYCSVAGFPLPSMRLFPLTLGKENSKRSKKQFQVQHGEPMSSFGLLTGAWIFVYLQEDGTLKGTCITNTQSCAPEYCVLCICGVPRYWRVSSPTAMTYCLHSLRKGICEFREPLLSPLLSPHSL